MELVAGRLRLPPLPPLAPRVFDWQMRLVRVGSDFQGQSPRYRDDDGTQDDLRPHAHPNCEGRSRADGLDVLGLGRGEDWNETANDEPEASQPDGKLPVLPRGKERTRVKQIEWDRNTTNLAIAEPHRRVFCEATRQKPQLRDQSCLVGDCQAAHNEHAVDPSANLVVLGEESTHLENVQQHEEGRRSSLSTRKSVVSHKRGFW